MKIQGYTLKQLSTIIKDDNYVDLSNHAIGAIGETGLFSLAEVCSSITFFLFHLIIVVLTFVFDSCRGSS